MSPELDQLLIELEKLSARAIEEVQAHDLTAAAQTVRLRGQALSRLQLELAHTQAISYEEWNRLVVIHFQGNRIGEGFMQARQRLAAQLVETSRDQALLNCVAGIVKRKVTPQIREIA